VSEKQQRRLSRSAAPLLATERGRASCTTVTHSPFHLAHLFTFSRFHSPLHL